MAEAKDNKKEEKRGMARVLEGTVVSDGMAKTVVVKVDRMVVHPRYGKRYKVSKNYKAHDERGQFKPGDKASIRECRPMSKDKRWRVIYKKK